MQKQIKASLHRMEVGFSLQIHSLKGYCFTSRKALKSCNVFGELFFTLHCANSSVYLFAVILKMQVLTCNFNTQSLFQSSYRLSTCLQLSICPGYHFAQKNSMRYTGCSQHNVVMWDKGESSCNLTTQLGKQSIYKWLHIYSIYGITVDKYTCYFSI